MNIAPHLLTEDRPDFERALDEALRAPEARTVPATGSHSLNTEQLRTMALSAADRISACAAAEYQAYLTAREHARESAAQSLEQARDDRPASLGHAAMGIADSTGPGAGLLAVVAVLTPILAGTAAAIFLLLGLLLGMMTPEPAIATPLTTAGWFFAAVAGGGFLAGMAALLTTALRNGSGVSHDDRGTLAPEVSRAREAWQRALIERGLLPFLDEASANAAGELPDAYRDPPAGEARVQRTPRLGYSRPGFSSPGPEESPLPGRRYSSPDYSGPGFGHPDDDPG